MFNFPGNSTTTALIASASHASTVTGSALDVIAYDGPCLIVQNKGAGVGSLAGKLQDSPDGTTDWADTGVVFAQAGTGAAIESVVFDTRSHRRFIRYVGTIVTGPQLCGVSFVGVKKVV